MIPATDSVTPTADRTHGSDCAELAHIVRQSGLPRRRYGYYAARCAPTIAAFAVCWVVFGVLGESWRQLVTAVFLALAYTQVSSLWGDAGHKQIFRGHRANDPVGLTPGDVVGPSYGRWIGKHNRRHATPNHVDDDPDPGIPALAFTNAQGSAKRGFLRWMAKYQVFLLFPRLLLKGLGLRWAGIQAVWHDQVRSRRPEKGLLIAHGISDRQCGLPRSYGQMLRHLHVVGAPARGMPPAPR